MKLIGVAAVTLVLLCSGCEPGGIDATTFTISGTVTLGGEGLAGVTVTANDGAGHTGTSVTAANGTYTIANLVAAAYTVTPELAGYAFAPAARNVTVGPSATGQDFAATADAFFTISGTVTLGAAGLDGVAVSVDDGAGHTNTVYTGADGAYTVPNLVAATYTVTPALAGHTFAPTHREVTIGPSAVGQDFTATATNGGANTNLFFLHHSTGQGIIDGGVRAAIAQYNTDHGSSFEFWDHGYNGDGLTNAAGVATGTNYAIPGDNTDPDGLHALWCSADADAVAARNAILTHHQVIAFKSCFPASHVADAAALAERQQWYLDMRDFFDTRADRVFMVMSTPPLDPLETDATEAANARAFANWLKSDTYLAGHLNVVCFDLFDELANPDDGSGTANMLREAYRQPVSDPPNSHPNDLANQTVAPVFAQALIDWSQGRPQP